LTSSLQAIACSLERRLAFLNDDTTVRENQAEEDYEAEELSDDTDAFIGTVPGLALTESINRLESF